MDVLNVVRYHWPEQPFAPDRCEGQKAKGVLVILENSDFHQHHALLKRILDSIGCNIEHDISLLQLQEGEEMRILSSPAIDIYSRIINFGIPIDRIGPASLGGGSLMKFEKFDLVNGPSLARLNIDQKAKHRLWADLKAIFEIDS